MELKSKCLEVFGKKWSLHPSNFARRCNMVGVTSVEVLEMYNNNYIERIVLGHIQVNI